MAILWLLSGVTYVETSRGKRRSRTTAGKVGCWHGESSSGSCDVGDGIDRGRRPDTAAGVDARFPSSSAFVDPVGGCHGGC